MKGLSLAQNFSLPIEAVTQAIGVLAKRRAGKSYLARRLAEQLFQCGQQVVIVDPKGDAWGIRSSADGKAPGLPIVILGGEHGDIQKLEPASGEVVAKLVIEERASILVDLSSFRKHEVATFMTAFLETLYRLKAREQYRTPVMLIVDEADVIAPQRPMKGEERMLGAAEDIVRRGGQRGIGCTLVTQRSAVLNKNVLTQVQVLIALRTIAPQDLDAMNAWIDVHGTPEQRRTLMESLPSLPVGDAWIWSPGWPTVEGIFKRVHVLPIETFDSGATPAPGERRIEPRNLADVDLEALRRQMAATIERSKAEDPRELRRKIATLEREVAEAKKAQPAAKVERLEVPVLKPEQERRLEGLAEVAGQLQRNQQQIQELLRPEPVILQQLVDAIRDLHTGLKGLNQPPGRKVEFRFDERSRVPLSKLKERGVPLPPKMARPTGPNEKLPYGERRILIAIAQDRRGATREQLTVLTGYKRSSRDAYLQRLRERGAIQISGDTITATEDGIRALGSEYEPLPTGAALRAHWLNRLPEGERRIFAILIEAYPDSVNRDSISESTAYKRSSRDAYVQRLRSRRLVDTIGRGELRASDELFE